MERITRIVCLKRMIVDDDGLNHKQNAQQQRQRIETMPRRKRSEREAKGKMKQMKKS